VRSYYKLLFFIIASFLFSCAKKGSPIGGPKDETAPLLVVTKPLHLSKHFEADQIKIYFDEFIVLKDLNKELIISPPLKTPPIITPQGVASKFIKIKLLDTLLPNTTYTFNFGDAVRDNNEGNIVEGFKYVFSTGSYIDSLKTTGSVIDGITGKLDKNVNVLLYELDSTYKDSTFFQQKPKYVAKTIDSIHFNFENIKEGKYFLMALEEENSDYLFDPKKDKLGFLLDTIALPKDSVLSKNLVLFKEKTPYKFKRGKEIKKGRIAFGYEGEPEDMMVKLISKVPDSFRAYSRFEMGKDTLNYWYTPIEGIDSLNFVVTQKNIVDSTTVKLKKKKLDSLAISSSVKGVLHLRDTVFINTNNPINQYDKDKFLFISDSLPVTYTLIKHKVNQLALLFDKKQDKKYTFTHLPNAIVDLYNTSVKDTLVYNFSTKNNEDYGSINLKVNSSNDTNIIIELLVSNKVLRRSFINKEKIDEPISFDLLEPNTYTIRAILDSNNNNRWDTGNFLSKIQPEKIIVFDKELELRANWILNEQFTIE